MIHKIENHVTDAVEKQQVILHEDNMRQLHNVLRTRVAQQPLRFRQLYSKNKRDDIAAESNLTTSLGAFSLINPDISRSEDSHSNTPFAQIDFQFAKNKETLSLTDTEAQSGIIELSILCEGGAMVCF